MTARDRDARALEQPIDVAAASNRIDLIRAAARKLREQPRVEPRLSIGRRGAGQSKQLPPLPTHIRRQQLDAAIAFLKRQMVLVSVVDRSALIRRYRVSGKAASVMAEDVIAMAIDLGLQLGGAA